MSDTLISVEKVSKKFCRNLKKSLWYGVKDLSSELIGRTSSHGQLRKDEFWALQDVSLELKRGDTLGLIGRNGAGKTTLLRMINSLIKPDSGRIEIKGRMQALIALGAGFNPILTGRENIYVNASVLGIPKTEVDRRFDEIINFAGIPEFIDSPVQSYSSGMSVRLGFAVAAHMEPDILLVDEVLAVGDEGFQSKCLNKIGELKKNGTAIILVSHNMHTISTFAKKVILIKDGRHELYENVSEGIREYKSLFLENHETDTETICSGNAEINFSNIFIKNQNLRPGDDFLFSVEYDSVKEFNDVEVDIAIHSGNEVGLYFQATNKAYGNKINFSEGKGVLSIKVSDIRINNATGRIGVAIWSKRRDTLLFWWRISLTFLGVDHCTGNNFLSVSYMTDERSDSQSVS